MDDHGLKLTVTEAAELLTRNDQRIHLVSMMGRLGASALMATLEWTFFRPGEPDAKYFDVHVVLWSGHPFFVASLPAARQIEARRIAKQLGVRLVRGLPVIFASGATTIVATSGPSRLAQLGVPANAASFFPGAKLPDGRDNPAIFVVENDHNSPVYRNLETDFQAMCSAEDEIVDLLNRGVRLTPAQIADYIYGSGAFPNAG